MTLLMFAFNPLTKYSLLVKPITSTLESIAGITGKTHIVGLRISVNASILLFACLCPAFHRVMGFIGAALSFTIVTITPTACYLKLNPNGHILKRMTCWTVLVFGSFFMVFSTVAIVMYNK